MSMGVKELRARSEAFARAGRCIDCGAETEGASKRCRVHAQRNRERRRKLYRERRAAGLCVDCGLQASGVRCAVCGPLHVARKELTSEERLTVHLGVSDWRPYEALCNVRGARRFSTDITEVTCKRCLRRA